MHKYKIILEYDGANYRGWQKQKNAKSVQETLTAAAEEFLGAPADIQGAGRTDAGVHALAQVAHLETEKLVDPGPLRAGLNEILPETITVLSVENAHPRFHARHHAVARSYLYLVATRRSAFARRYAWWVQEDLDLEALRTALDLFRGFHDFTSFTDKRMEKGSSTQVSVEGLWMRKFDDIIAMRVLGSHFLWKMVRRIMGVIVEAGRGNLTVPEIEGMLLSYSEVPKKCTAPAHGLFLETVLYEGDSLPEMRLPLAVW